MSDELVVCIVILILSAIITTIWIIYICALLAITRSEECQKDERDVIRDPVDELWIVPEDIPEYGVDNETLLQQIDDLSDALSKFGCTEQEAVERIIKVRESEFDEGSRI